MYTKERTILLLPNHWTSISIYNTVQPLLMGYHA